MGKVFPDQFRTVDYPEPTLEQYAAVKLETGMRSVGKIKEEPES